MNCLPSAPILVLPGTLLPAGWLAGQQLESALPAIARALADGRLRLADLPGAGQPLSRPSASKAACAQYEAPMACHQGWAHDAWLGQQPPLAACQPSAGTISALRQLMRFPQALASLADVLPPACAAPPAGTGLPAISPDTATLASPAPGPDRLARPGPAPSSMPGPACGQTGATAGQAAAWLLQPVAFRIATDSMLLDASASSQLDDSTASQLTETIAPLLADEGFSLQQLAPDCWLLLPQDSRPHWQLHTTPVEMAGEQHIDTLLPDGADSRRFRRLLNEIQMSWHLLNQDSEEDLPVNAVWLSGPLTRESVEAGRALLAQGLQLDERFLACRRDRDLGGWLNTLPALDRLYTDAPDPARFACLLCGEQQCRWLFAPDSTVGAALASPRPAGSAPRQDWLKRLSHRFRALLAGQRPPSGSPSTAPALNALFSETP